MKKLAIFCVFAVLHVLPTSGSSIESITKDVFVKTSKDNFVYALSNQNSSYYYATCKPSGSGTEECIVREEAVSKNGAVHKKTCIIDYKLKSEEGKEQNVQRILKTWSNRNALLVNLHGNTLYGQQIHMTDCKYKSFTIPNVEKFQVYLTSDDEFDIFWTSTNSASRYIMKTTYNEIGEVLSPEKVFTRRPLQKFHDNSWKILFFGDTSLYRENRDKDSNLYSEVISRVLPGNTNMTDDWTTYLRYSDNYDADATNFVTSNEHDELGICNFYDLRKVQCARYYDLDEDPKKKSYQEFDFEDFLHGRNRSYIKLHNLPDGKLMFLYVDNYDGSKPEIRSFTAFLLPDHGNSLEIKFQDKKFTCTSKLETKLIEYEDKYCFQFICSDDYDGVNGKKDPSYSTLQFRMKCVSKELFGTEISESNGDEPSSTTTPAPPPNSSFLPTSYSIFSYFLIAFMLKCMT